MREGFRGEKKEGFLGEKSFHEEKTRAFLEGERVSLTTGQKKGLLWTEGVLGEERGTCGLGRGDGGGGEERDVR